MNLEQQYKLLSEDLVKGVIKERDGLSYIEGYHAMDEANRIFGFNNWSYEVTSLEETYRVEKTVGYKKAKGYQVCFTARVKTTVTFADGSVAIREDVGSDVKTAAEANFATAIDNGTKGAITDALKRSLRSFGNQFGNALYDKEQTNVSKGSKKTMDMEEHFDEQAPTEKAPKDVKEPKKKASKETSDKKTTQEKTVASYKKTLAGLESVESYEQFRADNKDAILNHTKSSEIKKLCVARKKELRNEEE